MDTKRISACSSSFFSASHFAYISFAIITSPSGRTSRLGRLGIWRMTFFGCLQQASMRVGATDRIVRNVKRCTTHASCAASTCTHLVKCIYIALSHYNWMSPLQNSLPLQSFLRKSTYSYFLLRRNLKPQESLHIYTAVLLDSILLKAQITIPSSSTKVTRILFTLYVEHM